MAFIIVVLPEPVPPETTMFSRPRGDFQHPRDRRGQRAEATNLREIDRFLPNFRIEM